MMKASVWFVQGAEERGGGVRRNSRGSHRVGECMNGPSVCPNFRAVTKIITTKDFLKRLYNIYKCRSSFNRKGLTKIKDINVKDIKRLPC